MATLKEEAQAYEPPITKNVTELEVVRTDLNILEKESENSEGKKFKYKYFVQDGQEYRVPNSVLEQLQTMLKANANLKIIQVTKTGEGLKTKYKVEPLS